MLLCNYYNIFDSKISEIKLTTNLKFNLHFTNIEFSTKEVFNNYFKKYKNNTELNDFYKIIINLNANNLYNLNVINDLLSSVVDINNCWFNLYKNCIKRGRYHEKEFVEKN